MPIILVARWIPQVSNSGFPPPGVRAKWVLIYGNCLVGTAVVPVQPMQRIIYYPCFACPQFSLAEKRAW
ncbi:hypothetical protein, partial [Syntrophaceticus schinkii]|uniref:hypothetical protein n=1 Tax=Syntrophaceticus schinkii TaxID=499207 RepID=UPI002FC2CF4F